MSLRSGTADKACRAKTGRPIGSKESSNEMLAVSIILEDAVKDMVQCAPPPSSTQYAGAYFIKCLLVGMDNLQVHRLFKTLRV